MPFIARAKIYDLCQLFSQLQQIPEITANVNFSRIIRTRPAKQAIKSSFFSVWEGVINLESKRRWIKWIEPSKCYPAHKIRGFSQRTLFKFREGPLYGIEMESRETKITNPTQDIKIAVDAQTLRFWIEGRHFEAPKHSA